MRVRDCNRTSAVVKCPNPLHVRGVLYENRVKYNANPGYLSDSALWGAPRGRRRRRVIRSTITGIVTAGAAGGWRFLCASLLPRLGLARRFWDRPDLIHEPTFPGSSKRAWRLADRYWAIPRQVEMARQKIHHLPGKNVRSIMANAGFGSPIIIIGLLGFANGVLSLQLTLWAVLVGVALIVAGLAINRISIPFVRLIRDETKFTARSASLKPPFARILLSTPFFVVSGYVIGFTDVPYVVPFIPFVIGTYLYFRGVARFWVNQHTIYYVTNRGRGGLCVPISGTDHQRNYDQRKYEHRTNEELVRDDHRSRQTFW